MESLNEEKESFVDVLSLKGRMGELNEDESRLRQGWTSLMHQVTVFRTSLRTLLGAALLGKVLTLDFRWRGRCFIRAQDRALPLPTQYHLCRTLILREVYGILLKYKIIQSYVGHQSWFTIEDKVVFPIGGFWCFVWAVDSSLPSFVRIDHMACGWLPHNSNDLKFSFESWGSLCLFPFYLFISYNCLA